VRPFTDAEIELLETFAQQAVIAIESARQVRETQARLERERATSDILRVISESRTDEAPVFESILSHAARLCRAPMAWLLLLNAERSELRLAAYHGLSRRALAIGQVWPMTPERARTGLGQALADALTVQEEDLTQTRSYREGDPGMVQLVDEEGLRTRVSVPLVRDGRSIGAIVLSRREVSHFSEDDIRLVDTFAGQAVIAIENVRQFREVQERLERERASAEILEVISRSRDDEKPVFEAILDNAQKLCKAPMSALVLAEPGAAVQTLAAHRNAPLGTVEMYHSGKMAMDPAVSYNARAILEGRLIQFTDMSQSDLYIAGSPVVRAMVDDSNIRSVLFAPLITAHGAIGTITLIRYDVDPFSADEIELVESFAAQAVIAIENVRQFREVQKRLEGASHQPSARRHFALAR
jgi:GAF domain-containing protein